MSYEFVRPDKVIRVPIFNGEMLISPAHDFIHHWPKIGAYILKYVATDGENNQRQCNVPVNQVQAEWLIANCDMEYPLIRTFMGEEEHNHWAEWQTNNLDELDFEVEDEKHE